QRRNRNQQAIDIQRVRKIGDQKTQPDRAMPQAAAVQTMVTLRDQRVEPFDQEGAVTPAFGDRELMTELAILSWKIMSWKIMSRKIGIGIVVAFQPRLQLPPLRGVQCLEILLFHREPSNHAPTPRQ